MKGCLRFTMSDWAPNSFRCFAFSLLHICQTSFVEGSSTERFACALRTPRYALYALAGLACAQPRRPRITVSNASKYSWHSARIYLACSLLAAGASHAQIQALCRWQTEDSLRVYARLNPSSYDKLLSRAAGAQVESVSVGSLPPLSSELAIRQLLGLSLVDALAAGA